MKMVFSFEKFANDMRGIVGEKGVQKSGELWAKDIDGMEITFKKGEKTAECGFLTIMKEWCEPITRRKCI